MACPTCGDGKLQHDDVTGCVAVKNQSDILRAHISGQRNNAPAPVLCGCKVPQRTLAP